MKKIINLNEDNIKQILQEKYNMTSIEEIMEYMWLKTKFTNLKVDIFVDDGQSYLRHNHVPIVFARNGYDKSVSEFIPFLLSKNPIVLDDEMDFNISYDDIFDIQDFIVNNLNILNLLADRKISQTVFVKNINIPSYVLREEKTLLNEMSTLRTEDSGLPMDIWLDEGATFQGHVPRLKFRASREQRTTKEFSSMLLTNPPSIENMPDDSPLRKKDIDKLKLFVINNLDLLLKLANGEIDYVREFLPNCKFYMEEKYLKLFNKLPSQQIKPVKIEDIPGEIERILSKVLKNKNIKVNGNGLTEPINIKIKDEK